MARSAAAMLSSSGLVEQRAVHVLANDSDTDAIQTRLAGESWRTTMWACGRR
jgi:hypothetical protein